MTINFPPSPTDGQIFRDPSSGAYFRYNAAEGRFFFDRFSDPYGYPEYNRVLIDSNASSISGIRVIQQNHGFSVGVAVKFDNTQQSWLLGKADFFRNYATHVVTEVINTDECYVSNYGHFYFENHGLPLNRLLYCSEFVDGLLTSTITTINQSQPLAQAIDSNNLLLLPNTNGIRGAQMPYQILGTYDPNLDEVRIPEIGVIPLAPANTTTNQPGGGYIISEDGVINSLNAGSANLQAVLAGDILVVNGTLDDYFVITFNAFGAPPQFILRTGDVGITGALVSTRTATEIETAGTPGELTTKDYVDVAIQNSAATNVLLNQIQDEKEIANLYTVIRGKQESTIQVNSFLWIKGLTFLNPGIPDDGLYIKTEESNFGVWARWLNNSLDQVCWLFYDLGLQRWRCFYSNLIGGGAIQVLFESDVTLTPELGPADPGLIWTINAGNTVNDPGDVPEIEVIEDNSELRVWSSLEAYVVDDLVIYQNELYIAIVNNGPAGFNPAEWRKLGREVNAKLGRWDPEAIYEVDDLTFYNGHFWVANTQHGPIGTGNPFPSTFWNIVDTKAIQRTYDPTRNYESDEIRIYEDPDNPFLLQNRTGIVGPLPDVLDWTALLPEIDYYQNFTPYHKGRVVSVEGRLYFCLQDFKSFTPNFYQNWNRFRLISDQEKTAIIPDELGWVAEASVFDGAVVGISNSGVVALADGINVEPIGIWRNLLAGGVLSAEIIFSGRYLDYPLTLQNNEDYYLNPNFPGQVLGYSDIDNDLPRGTKVWRIGKKLPPNTGNDLLVSISPYVTGTRVNYVVTKPCAGPLPLPQFEGQMLVELEPCNRVFFATNSTTWIEI